MARGGIYKSEVVRARTKLQSLGTYPSIDAIRQELGTGSKATIHRYLKEIEEEEGSKAGDKTAGKVAISEALQDLVARLAERLHIEADVRIADLTAKHGEELAKRQHTFDAAQAEIAGLQQALARSQDDVSAERGEHQRTAERLQQERVALAQAMQQVTDLGDRLNEADRHRQSLEEKHTHAREALEHFRTAAKDQREQDQRQHEQQVQYLQSEIKSLKTSLVQAQLDAANGNKENARIVGELARAERSLHDVRAELRPLKDAKAALDSAQQQVERLGRRVVELETQVQAQDAHRVELEGGLTAAQVEIQQLRVDLAAAQATAETQDQFAEQIKALIGQKAGNTTRAPGANPHG